MHKQRQIRHHSTTYHSPHLHRAALCGLVAFGVFLALIFRLSEAHSVTTSRGEMIAWPATHVRELWGWSFWLFFGSVVSALWSSIVLICC